MIVVAPAFYSDIKKVHYLTESATHHGIPLKLYGLRQPYTDWITTHITELRQVLLSIDDDLVFFTDASDALFLGTEAEIVQLYRFFGSPPLLMSMERDRQINAGGWMGQRGYILACLDAVEECGDSGDPQVRWRTAIRDKNPVLSEVEMDRTSIIFQVGDADRLVKETAGLYNAETGHYPCHLHFAGGYTDPEFGKAAQISPTWKKLGYGS